MTQSFVPALSKRNLEDGLSEYYPAMHSGTVSEHARMASVPNMTYSDFATWVAINIHMSRQRTDPRAKLAERHGEYDRLWNKRRGIDDED